MIVREGMPIRDLKGCNGMARLSLDPAALQQLQSRQVLRINNSNRRVAIVDNYKIIDAMAFQQIENFDGEFVLVNAYWI